MELQKNSIKAECSYDNVMKEKVFLIIGLNLSIEFIFIMTDI